jgi:oligoribonuclease
MLWVDLEMTGLEPSGDVVLEFGLATSDRFGNIINEASWVINDQSTIYDQAIGRMVPFVRDMHTKSGLLEEVRSGDAYSCDDAEKMIFRWLEDNVPIDKRGIMPTAGSSVRLDRSFIEMDYSTLLGFWHPYRILDVSSFKEGCKILNPEMYEKAPNQNKANAAHRVLDDIHASAGEWGWYVDNFLFVA